MPIVLLLSPSPSSPLAPQRPLRRPSGRAGDRRHPLTDTERALRECLARQSPPNEDIGAALGHAENLFVAGAIP